MMKSGIYTGTHNTDVRKHQTFTKEVDFFLSLCADLSPAESYRKANTAEANFELVLYIASMPAALPQTTRQNAQAS